MVIENYSPGIRALISQIKEYRADQNPAIMDSLNTLLKIGQRMKDNALIGYAYLFMADAYFDNPYPYEDFIRNLTEGMKHQILAGENEMIARSYNLIHIDAYTHGSRDMSLEALAMAKSYCDRIPASFFQSILLHNIGNAYNRVGDTKRALQYRIDSLEYLRAMKDHSVDSQYQRNIVLALGAIGIHHFNDNHPDKAEEIAAQIDALEDTAEGIPGAFSEAITLIFRIMLAHSRQDNAYFDTLLDQLCDKLNEDLVLADCLDDLLLLLHYLLREGRTDAIDTILNRLRPFMERRDDTMNARIALYDFDVEYREKTGDAQKAADALEGFCRCSLAQDKTLITSCNFTLEMSRTMESQRAEQIRILEDDIRRRHVAQTDPLTDLPNTVYFMERIEDALDSAVFRHSNIGVSVLTIPVELSVDPSRLQEAVATLTALSTSGVCVTKGESNRLLVLYEDMPNSDIMQRAEDVTHVLMPFVQDTKPAKSSGFLQNFLKQPQAVGIPHGVCTGVPTQGTGGWEYLSVAAEAMQDSMKNSFEIMHYNL